MYLYVLNKGISSTKKIGQTAVFAVVVLEISFSKEHIDCVCHAICLKFHLEPSWNHLEPMVNKFGQRFRKTIFEDLKKRLKKDWKDVMQVSQPGQSWHCLELFARAKTHSICNLYPWIIQHSCGMLRNISLFDLFLDDVLAYL